MKIAAGWAKVCHTIALCCKIFPSCEIIDSPITGMLKQLRFGNPVNLVIIMDDSIVVFLKSSVGDIGRSLPRRVKFSSRLNYFVEHDMTRKLPETLIHCSVFGDVI